MKITAVRTHVLLDPGYEADATSSAQDDIVVEIETDEGLVGVGESDVNAWVARACIEAPGTHTMDQGLGQVLIGLDPGDPVAVWERVYRATAMTGRRGALVHAMGAVDMAIWDLAGKARGVPVWRLLGEPVRQELTPYASLLPQARTLDEFQQALVAQAVWARDAGFRAVKLELPFTGPYVSTGLAVGDAPMGETIAAVRRAIGDEMTLMVDVVYAWRSVDHALRGDRDLGRLRTVLRRDAALAGRPGRVSGAVAPIPDPDRERRVAEHRARVRGSPRAGWGPDRAAGRGACGRHHRGAQGVHARSPVGADGGSRTRGRPASRSRPPPS